MDLATAFKRDRPVLVMTALGLASGIVGSFTYQLEPLWRELSVGLLFGVVVAAYLWRLGLAGPLRTSVFIALAVLAWLAAERAAIEIFNALPGAGTEFFSLKGLVSGIAAGLLGAFLLMLAGALLFPFYRRPGLGLATVATGGAAGVLLTLLDLADSGLVLFPPWQAAVAFCLGRGLPRRRTPEGASR